MTLTRRPAALGAFLAAGLIGLVLVSLVPGPAVVPVILGALWTSGAWVLGNRWFLRPAEGPVLEPNSLEPPSAPVAAVDEVPGPEPETPVLESGSAVEPVRDTDGGLRNAVADLVSALEAEWARPDLLGPGLNEVLANEVFIRDNVQRAFEIADNLSGSAERAFALSEKVQKGVKIVTDALLESLKQTEVLSRHSEQITGILAGMAEVSDKIHVLSINASIVSARAGTAGKGFEVVAKEIRALAKESEASLGGIVDVIELLRSSIAQVSQVVGDADVETEQEKDALIEVAGALQGVSLGVEIVKTVSSFARDKADDQGRLVQTLSDSLRGVSPGTLQKVADVKARLASSSPKE